MQTEERPPQEVIAVPASYAQQRIWFLDQFEHNGAVYNVPLAKRLRGPLDLDALDRALTALVERHEALHTIFTSIEGVPHQLVGPLQPSPLEVTDLSGTPDAEARVRELADEFGRRRFDLAADVPVRWAVFRLGEEDHVLVLTVHHIVADAWSMTILGRELGVLYAAFVADRRPELPELPIQYADYAVWQRNWIESGGLDQQLGYWKQQLAGAPALLSLPLDHPRPAQQSFRGATVREFLSKDLLAELKTLAEREGKTLYMTLLAAFSVLLHRYSGQDDVVVASPVANRGRVELESLIGCFVNTLALRTELHADPSFVELLDRVQETSLEALANQDLPFEKLVEELRPERNLSHSPLAQVMFVFQSGPGRVNSMPGLAEERIEVERRTAKFDLTLFAAETADGLRVSIEYCSDLFERTTAEQMLRHFGVLLAGIAENPALPISRLPLLSDRDRRKVLADFNDAGPAAPGIRPVHELVHEQARRTPDACAVQLGSQRLSYAELDSRANALAHRLRDLGVGPDIPVAICAERSVAMAIAVLAVLKAGGAYAPIDPVYPADRITFMLADMQAPVVLTQEHLRGGLPETSAHVICLDSDLERGSVPADTPPPGGPMLDHLAYVIYTSGSTGRPKGVAMTHRPLANLIAWQLDSWSTPGPARTLQFASLSFDVAFQELFSTWCSGGTLVLLDEHTRRDPTSLLHLLVEEKVQRLFLPFIALQNICEAADQQVLSVPTLRDVLTAGEQLKITPAIRSFFFRHPHCALFNQYGPSESHVVTAFRLEGDASQWSPVSPIGQPIPGAKVHVLDSHLQPVPIGVTGELCIGGVSVAQGYLNRPELTRERFVRDPFSAEAGARLYRTGDLSRYRADGTLEYLGRLDQQVKVRGFRIEPGEIEAVLRGHPAVREALVIAREDALEDRQLVAYVVNSDSAPTAGELRDFLARTLPDYMVPTAFLSLDEFPQTPNGKVDRAALPVPDENARARHHYAAPSTPLERSLAAIWRDLLGLERVGVDDNFFALGGHSLLAVRLVEEVRERLIRYCTLSIVFRNPTIRSLAVELEAGGGPGKTPTLLKLHGDGDGPALFCVSGVHVYQEFAEAMPPDLPVYGLFHPIEQRLFESGRSRWGDGGKITVEELAEAYVQMVREHSPTGPYLLVGFCFGGVVAYEMSQQLARLGEETGLLVMLDCVLPGTTRPRGRYERWRRTLGDVKYHMIRNWEEESNALKARLGLATTGLSRVHRLDRMRMRGLTKAIRRYEPQPRAGTAFLIQAETTLNHWRLLDPTFGWGRYISELETCPVPGSHHGHLKRPAVDLLANIVRPRIDQIRARAKQG